MDTSCSRPGEQGCGVATSSLPELHVAAGLGGSRAALWWGLAALLIAISLGLQPPVPGPARSQQASSYCLCAGLACKLPAPPQASARPQHLLFIGNYTSPTLIRGNSYSPYKTCMAPGKEGERGFASLSQPKMSGNKSCGSRSAAATPDSVLGAAFVTPPWVLLCRADLQSLPLRSAWSREWHTGSCPLLRAP